MSAPGDFYNVEWSADAHECLAELVDARDWIEWKIEQAVVECRLHTQSVIGIETDTLHDTNRELVSYAPLSWRAIGEMLGIGPEAARRRYAHLVEDARGVSR